MAKQSGLGDNFYVAQYDLSGDVGALDSITTAQGTTGSTGINKSGNERLGTHKDGAVSFTTYFNDATSQEHDALKVVPSTDVILSYFRGTTLGNPAASMVAKRVDYIGNRNEDGSLTFKASAQANGFGLEWGNQLTAGKRTDGSATNGTGVDFTASSSFGLQAYLHVFAFTGTSVTVKIQESSDNGVGDAWADVTGGTFTVASGVTSERIATASGLSVERYLRAITTGTFSNAVFAVNVVRNLTSTVF